MSMIALRPLLFAAAFLVAVAGTAHAQTGVVTRAGSQAQMLVLGATVPEVGARLSIGQSDLLGATVASVMATVTAVNDGVVTLDADGQLATGPADFTLIGGSMRDANAPVSGSVVGMSVGDLEPNFVLPADDDVTDSAGVGATDSTTDPAEDEQARILALVREWIAVAEPPHNADPGWALTYTQWGQMEGTTPTGTITIVAKPDDAVGLTYDLYLWTRLPGLRSLNHCTLRAYVTTRLADGDIAACRGEASGGGPGNTPAPVTHNEDSDGPQSIAGTATITGLVLPQGDRDEFVFTAPHHGEWTFTVAEAPPDVDVNLGVYPAPNGGWLPDMAANGDGRLVVDLPEPADYILRVWGRTGGMESETPYRIEAVFTPSLDVFEPNQSAEQAPQISGSGQLTGTVLPRGERDHFIFDAPHHGAWTIAIAHAPAGVDVELGVFPYPDGGWLPDMSEAGDGRLVVDLPEPGKYVLRAWGRTGGMRSVEPYVLDLAFIPSPDRFEPNHDIDQATAIAGTAQLVGTILPRGERDQFLFDAPHHGEWAIAITDSPEGLDLELGVFPHPDGGWLPDMSEAGDGRLVVDLPEPGQYVLRAWGRTGGMRSVEPYLLDLAFTPSPDTFEPNNTIEQAPVISGSGPLVGTILPRGERDQFIFDALHHGEWIITIADAPEDLDLELGVYPHPDGGWLPDMSEAGDGRLIVDLPEPGHYVLRAWGRTGGMRSVEPYRLDLGFRASVDIGEPNNSVEEATPFGLGDTVTGTVLPRGERDQYLFSVGGPATARFVIQQSPPGVDLELGVFPFPDGGWLRDLSESGDGQLVVELPEAGRYVLRVWGRTGGMRSIEPYVIGTSIGAANP